MEAGFIALLVLMSIVGVVVGFLIGKKKIELQYLQDTRCTQGTLNIDCSNPEFGPELFLGLGIPVEDVISRKYIILGIRVMNQNSHQ